MKNKMIKKILAMGVFIAALFISTPMSGAELVAHQNKNGWDKIQINQYDVAVVWVTDNPEAYYVLDARADLCFFVVSTTNGISTTRVPCRPFIDKIETLEDKYDRCE